MRHVPRTFQCDVRNTHIDPRVHGPVRERRAHLRTLVHRVKVREQHNARVRRDENDDVPGAVEIGEGDCLPHIAHELVAEPTGDSYDPE